MKTLGNALLIGLVASGLEAQVMAPREPRQLDQWIFGMSVYPAFSVGDFAKDQRVGGGLDMTIAYQPFRREMTVIRGAMGFMQYDSYQDNEEGEVCDFFGNNCTNETFFYDSQNHSTSFFHIGPEFMVTAGTWRPYVFATGGVTFFHSTARFGDTNDPSSGSRGLFYSHNVSSAYGIGIRRVTAKEGRQFGWELGARFNRNAKAEYLTKDGVYRDANGNYAVSPKTGQANWITVHLGFNTGPRLNWNER